MFGRDKQLSFLQMCLVKKMIREDLPVVKLVFDTFLVPMSAFSFSAFYIDQYFESLCSIPDRTFLFISIRY